GRKGGGLFLGYLLGKNIGGRIALISFHLTWDAEGVLSFRWEAREASGIETARLRNASRRRSGCVAARGAGAAGGDAGDRLSRYRIRQHNGTPRGGVSIFGLQLGRMMGIQAIITSSRDDKLARAKALGANHGINYKTTPDWEKAAVGFTGGRGVDHVVEVG